MVHRAIRTIRVFLVAEHPSLLQSLALLLKGEGMIVCGKAADAETALREMPRDADLVLVGLSGGGQGGLGLLRAMHARPELPPVLVLSANDDAYSIGLAIAAGARGYVPNRRADELLADAIRAVVSGRCYLPGSSESPGIRSGMPRRSPPDPSGTGGKSHGGRR